MHAEGHRGGLGAQVSVMDNTLPGYLTVAETAKLAGLTQNTIRHHCRTGTLRAYGLGNTWLIPVQAAMDFVLKRGEVL